jgi:hypothetical protein
MAHSITLINNSKFNEKPKLLELAKILNTSLNYNDTDPDGSIMHYGQMCNCDDGFMCEHRLEKVLDFIDLNFNSK